MAPSRRASGCPSAWPSASQAAMSIPDIAKSTMLCTPSSVYFARSLRSMSNGATASPFSISAIASTSLAIGGRLCLPMPNRYERPTMPASVCRSMSSSAAAVSAPVLAASGRFMGAATARVRMLSIFSSFPLEARLALLHERAPALLVVLALRAALHRRAHAPGVRRTGGFHVFLDDGLGISDRQRRVFTQGLKNFPDRVFQLG